MKLKLQTEGMHCGSCEILVKDALGELEGVRNVEASWKTGIVDVDFDESKTDKMKIIETIKKQGYKVRR